MTIGSTPVPAGWYKDPAGSPAMRWWDGTQWTNHLQQPAPPVAPVYQAPVQQAPMQQQPVYQAQRLRAPGMQAPVQYAPTQPEVNLGAYRPGSGFGAAVQQQPQQNGWGADPYGNGRAVPLGRISNRLAWISLVAGILAVSAIFILIALPKGTYYLPVFGLTAIISGIRAIVGYRRGTVTVLWAPIVGLALGAIAEFILLLGLIVAATGLAVGSTSDAPSNSTSQGGTSTTPGVTPGLIGPTGSIINYDAGYGSPRYLPQSNGELSEVATQESKVVSDLQSTFAPGKIGAAADGSWPTGLTANSSGDVVTSEDQNLGFIIQPGWHLVYESESDGSYLLGITASNTTEMALYSSKTGEYAIVCEATDQTCVTPSPLKPITATNNAGSTAT